MMESHKLMKYLAAGADVLDKSYRPAIRYLAATEYGIVKGVDK